MGNLLRAFLIDNAGKTIEFYSMKLIANSQFIEFHFYCYREEKKPGLFYCVRWEKMHGFGQWTVRIYKGDQSALGPWELVSEVYSTEQYPSIKRSRGTLHIFFFNLNLKR